MFFNARYSKLHMGNFVDEWTLAISLSRSLLDYHELPCLRKFDAQTMMGTLPIQLYVSTALDNHIKGIETIARPAEKPLHVNFIKHAL